MWARDGLVGPVGLVCNIRWGYLQNASFWAVLTQPVFIEQDLSHEIEVVVGPMGFVPTNIVGSMSVPARVKMSAM